MKLEPSNLSNGNSAGPQRTQQDGPTAPSSFPSLPSVEPERPHPVGLSALAAVTLDPPYQRLLDLARANCGGPVHWVRRKLAEAHDLLALAQISSRMQVLWLDLTAELRAMIDLRAPVPCLAGPEAPLQILPLARLGLRYPQEALVAPQPGYSFVQVLAPRNVWLANVSRDDYQVVCLGATLPISLPIKELVMMTYGALTLQAIQIDLTDPAGVLNAAAAEWWQSPPNLRRIPLSREPFIFHRKKI